MINLYSAINGMITKNLIVISDHMPNIEIQSWNVKSR